MPVRTANDIRRVVEGVFTVVPEKSNEHEVTIICPEPGCGDRSGNRGINVGTLLTNCWRCGKGGHLGSWAKRLGYELDLEEGGRMVGATIDEVAGLLDELSETEHVRPVSGYVPSVELPEGFTYVKDEPDCAYARLIGRMARQEVGALRDFSSLRVGPSRLLPGPHVHETQERRHHEEISGPRRADPRVPVLDSRDRRAARERGHPDFRRVHPEPHQPEKRAAPSRNRGLRPPVHLQAQSVAAAVREDQPNPKTLP